MHRLAKLGHFQLFIRANRASLLLSSSIIHSYYIYRSVWPKARAYSRRCALCYASLNNKCFVSHTILLLRSFVFCFACVFITLFRLQVIRLRVAINNTSDVHIIRIAFNSREKESHKKQKKHMMEGMRSSI